VASEFDWWNRNLGAGICRSFDGSLNVLNKNVWPHDRILRVTQRRADA
jgi:hypothetical protein